MKYRQPRTRNNLNSTLLARSHQFFASLKRKLQTCYLCGCHSSELICDTCHHDMLFLFKDNFTFKPVFTRTRDILEQPAIADKLVHDHIDHLFTPFAYQWPISQLIKDLKFSRKLLLADYLADVIAQQFTHDLSPQVSIPEAIIPMPIHYKRYRIRKYNQCHLIAKRLNAKLNLPVLSDICSRKINTQAQTELTGNKRRKNTKEAFLCKAITEYEHVVILDDVVTTGATVNSLAHAIRCANSHIKIDVWAVAISLN